MEILRITILVTFEKQKPLRHEQGYFYCFAHNFAVSRHGSLSVLGFPIMFASSSATLFLCLSTRAARSARFSSAQAAVMSDAFKHWKFKKHFIYITENGSNLTVQCKQCLPAIKKLSTSKQSMSNLRKHLEVSATHWFISDQKAFILRL